MHQWQTNNNNREQMNKHNKYNIQKVDKVAHKNTKSKEKGP